MKKHITMVAKVYGITKSCRGEVDLWQLWILVLLTVTKKEKVDFPFFRKESIYYLIPPVLVYRYT